MTSPLALAGAPGIAVERCNPFGHATDKGPKHLMGGMYGPQYEGKIKWVCKAPATGRYRMECRCDALRHVPAPVMPLCLHHLAMIRKRMSDACTTCMLPQRNIELANEYLAVQDLLRTAQLDGAPEARLLARRGTARHPRRLTRTTTPGYPRRFSRRMSLRSPPAKRSRAGSGPPGPVPAPSSQRG